MVRLLVVIIRRGGIGRDEIASVETGCCKIGSLPPLRQRILVDFRGSAAILENRMV